MQTQQEWRTAWLPMADHFDRLLSIGSRARMHGLAAAARMLHGKPPITFVPGPAHPYQVVSDGPLARLLLYPRQAGSPALATPLLIVSSLINRYYVLDLLPELSIIGLMNARGFDVYVLDWKAPGDLGPSLRFSDYVDGAIASAAADAARAAGAKGVAVLGYCMGGTLAAIHAARHPEQVRSLTLLGTPIDFHASGILAGWTRPELFDADLLIDVLGNMPPTLMQSAFKLMNPADAIFKMLHLAEDGENEQRVRHVVALESWLDDNIAFPGGVYREYIKGLYQENALIAGKFLVGGDAVNLSKIVAPLLNVIALRDHICAPPASRALQALVASVDKTALEFETGHIGMTTSRRAHKELWPRILDWMVERC